MDWGVELAVELADSRVLYLLLQTASSLDYRFLTVHLLNKRGMLGPARVLGVPVVYLALVLGYSLSGVELYWVIYRG